ncbi:hypothetical protein EsVE80_21820 [Enterococcus saigonensis]|uniref:Uncharacterized protein n=1 Tax=Enterococcus saigonensis TaxID=1805431 RepID=A0A679IE95_9ENTE|nr:hypothetical protein [Enterococcus saigonensis]BCA86659.1 hypothetical protein EsVE80_21820 [Enterococcus saigonensis]
MKTKKVETILITKQSSFYQNVGENQVGFELSEYHNHAVVLTEYYSWDNPWENGGFWAPAGRKFDIYTGYANLNDLETKALIDDLKSKNIKFSVDSQIIEELKNLA